MACPRKSSERIAKLRAIHQVAGRRARTGTGQEDQALRYQQPSVVHPVVRTHPHTGRKCLYVLKGECEGIEGMPKEEALALIDELAEHTIAPQFRHVHHWRVAISSFGTTARCSTSRRSTTSGRSTGG